MIERYLPLCDFVTNVYQYRSYVRFSLVTWGQFHKAAEHKILLSLKMSSLAEMNYQPKYHVIYIGSDWFTSELCLASKFAKQNFLLNSFMKLAPVNVFSMFVLDVLNLSSELIMFANFGHPVRGQKYGHQHQFRIEDPRINISKVACLINPNI